MSIKRTIISTVLALALVAVVAPAVTQGVTIDELMAQIAALQAQLTNLSGSTPVPTGNVACAGITFTRNLVVGSTGSDVKCLQVLLNNNGYTLAQTGAGSPGMETSYFGSRTLAVVKAFQVAKGWAPANQVGPMTRAALNALINSGTTPYVPPVVTPTGSVAAYVASTSPAAGALIASQAQASLLDINFTGSGAVTTITLQRTGISDQNTLTNVYLYDGAVRLTDGYSFNINGTSTISGLNIAVSGSKVISVKADTAASTVIGSAGSSPASSIAVALTGFNGASANVQGNTMTIVSGTGAGASFGANTYVSTTPSVNAGTSQYTSWGNTLTISTRAVQLKALALKMIGSAPTTALTNVQLFVDGISTGRIASVVTVQGSNYEMFDFTAAPITLTTGAHSLEVRADISTGSNRTMQLSLQQASDITLFDSQIGVNIAPAGTVPNVGANMSILTGSSTIVVESAFNSQTNVPAGATNVVIGKFKIHGYGEDVKVSDLYVTPVIISASASGSQTCVTGTDGAWSAGTCGLNNVTLYLNGVQIGAQKNWTMSSASNSTAVGTGTIATATGIDFTLGSQMIITAGQDSTLEVKADLQNASSINYVNGTIQVSVIGQTTANAIGQVSQANILFPDTSDVTTSGLAVSSASLQVSKNTAVANSTAAPNTSNVKIGSFTLQNQSTSEAVRLTTLTVALDSNITGTDLDTTELTYISALRTSDTTGSGSTPIQPTASNTFSVSDVLQPNASMTIDIYANIGASLTTVATKLTVASIGVTSNVSDADANGVQTGQLVTIGTGTIASPTKVTSGTTASQYIVGGTTGASQTTFNFISASGASVISELKFVVTGSDANPTQTVTSVCVGTVCGQPISNLVYLQGLSLAVPNGGNGLSQPVTISYSNVGTSGVVPTSTALVSLSYVKYTSGGTTKTLCTTATGTCTGYFSPDANVDGNTMTLVGGKPTVVVAAGGGSGMVLNQSTKVGQATVTATGGSIKVRTIAFNVTWSGFSTLPDTTTAQSLTDSSGNTLTDFTCTSGSVSAAGAHTVTCTTGTSYATDFPISVGGSQQFDLYVTTGSGANTGASIPSAASTLVKASFLWDDTSDNGTTAAAKGMSGTLINGFPTNSYTTHQ